ncbi:hypothetical protein J3E69DRAFT_336560 [Trichoderma sp. SZMC 28015]
MALMPVQFAAVLCCTAVHALTVCQVLSPLRWILSMLLYDQSIHQTTTVKLWFSFLSPYRNLNSRICRQLRCRPR